MDKIFISFIIPVLNCEKYIEEAVFSIVNLGIENYEIIVVDNSSSDRTVDILKKMNFHNLQILQQPKKGVSAARNLAINAAKGEYIAFMDADDSYIKKTFKNTYNFILHNPDVEAVYMGLPEFCDNQMVAFKKQPKLNFKLTNNVFLLFSSRLFPTLQSLIIKKQTIQDLGMFNEELDIAEDFDLYLRLFEKVQVKIFNNNFAFKYRQNPNSLMHSVENTDKLVQSTHFMISKIREYDFGDKKLNSKKESLCSLKFLDLIQNVAKNGNKPVARKLLAEFFFTRKKINLRTIKRVAKILTVI